MRSRLISNLVQGHSVLALLKTVLEVLVLVSKEQGDVTVFVGFNLVGEG